MPKFNKRTSISTRIERHPDITTNFEGGIAFTATPKTDLTLRILTWLVGEPKFYGDTKTETQEIQRLIKVVAEQDPEYLMKLASYARNEMYLRSTPTFLLIEGVQYNNVKPLVRKYISKIVRRADELKESIALFISKHGEIGDTGKASLPNSLKKGLADTFHNFDRYQFAKYDSDRGGVKLKDVLRLVHPKPKDDYESETFRMIRDGILPIPQTWETVISAKGSTKEAWESVTPKMGYMATLRNLRNFLKVGANIEPVVTRLTNPKQVARSKQFPFRFLSAYKVLMNESTGDYQDRQRLIQAVAQALELSVTNVPQWKGRTYVTSDNSGSMRNNMSAKSSVERIEVASVMSAIAQKRSNGLASVFGQTFKPVPLNPTDSILTNAQRIATTNVGHSTNAWLALQYLTENKINVDRILVFSDMQCYTTYSGWYGRSDTIQSLQGQLRRYKQQMNPNVILYSFDLAGYGTLQFPEDEKNVVLLAGFSEKVFKFIQMYEEFDGNLIKDIEDY